MRCDDDFLYRKKDEQGFRRGTLLFLFQLTVDSYSAFSRFVYKSDSNCPLSTFTDINPLCRSYVCIAVIDLFDYVLCQIAESGSGDRIGV